MTQFKMLDLDGDRVDGFVLSSFTNWVYALAVTCESALVAYLSGVDSGGWWLIDLLCPSAC